MSRESGGTGREAGSACLGMDGAKAKVMTNQVRRIPGQRIQQRTETLKPEMVFICILILI